MTNKTQNLIIKGCEILTNQWQLDAETARAIMRQLLILGKEAGLKFVNPYIVAEHPETIQEIEI